VPRPDDRPLHHLEPHHRPTRRSLTAALPQVPPGLDLSPPHLGPVRAISAASRALAPALAALSSVNDAPRRFLPPPCDRRHQTPLLLPRRSPGQGLAPTKLTTLLQRMTTRGGQRRSAAARLRLNHDVTCRLGLQHTVAESAWG
jgi:hypothetical protein